MIVVDASAVVEVLVGRPPPSLAIRLAAEATLHVPHLLDIEVLHVLRRLVQKGSLDDRQAQEARDHLALLDIDRYPHAPLADRIWSLRANLSAYDASYVALAEVLDTVLVTTDARLGRAPGLSDLVEVHT